MKNILTKVLLISCLVSKLIGLKDDKGITPLLQLELKGAGAVIQFINNLPSLYEKKQMILLSIL